MSILHTPSVCTDIQESIFQNNYKLTADKIIQILDELRNDPKKSNRRWVWELMQNAKDVSNKFSQVSIEIGLNENSLYFSHNGDPFNISNITGLIQQVSSKSSSNRDEEITGKFGTGFISTHLLSNVIKVQGVVKRPEDVHRRFELKLDRSATTSEALLGSISDALKWALKIDNNEECQLLPNYEYSRTEDDLDTKFLYELSSAENWEAARAGITDLMYTLPATMVNIAKLKQVCIVHEDQSKQLYRCEKIRVEDSIAWYKVSVEDTSKPYPDIHHFIAYETPRLRLLLQVNNFEEMVLVAYNGKQPMLYRDFPLIGSEKFYFPFAINGFSFFPTEGRDNILINGDSDKPVHNRELLEEAQIAALLFTDWLIANNACNRSELAYTRIPEAGLDAKTTCWYKSLQRSWRTALLDRELVETELGVITLRHTRIPRYNLSAKHKENDSLWELVYGYLGANAVPARRSLQQWLNVVGLGGEHEEYDTWGHSILMNTEDLLRMVESAATLCRIPVGSTAETRIAWLNSLYTFLKNQNELHLLRKYAVVPNQYGEFRLLHELYVERAKEQIPGEILDVLKFLGYDWRGELICRDVQLQDLNHSDRGLRDASGIINDLLGKEEREKNVVKADFLSRADAQKVLVAILRLTTEDAKETTYRSRLFGFAKELLHFEEDLTLVASLENFSFNTAAKLLTRLLNQEISKTLTLNQLKQQLGRTEEETVMWLDSYLCFLDGSNEYKYLLKEGNIVLNRQGILCSYESLFNFGTKDQPLNETLLNILKQLDPNRNWFPKLLADEIHISLPQTFKFEELGTELVNFVNNLSHRNQYMEYRDQLLSLIDWCIENRKLANNYLNSFVEFSDRIFYILTIEKSGKSSDVVRLLRNNDNISDLVAIAESGVNIAQLKELAHLSVNSNLMDLVIAYARRMEVEHSNFRFLQHIGATMESIFMNALRLAGIEAKIQREGEIQTKIHYQGIGSYDFAIKNQANNKAFYIELKSYRSVGKPEPIRVAISQAKRAANTSEPFGLCIIGREDDVDMVTVEFVQKNLAYIGGVSQAFERVVNGINQLELLQHAQNEIWLEVPDFTSTKVRISHSFIERHKRSFDELIADIKSSIQ